MQEINRFRTFNKLKSIYRENSVKDRKESSAEHSWSCLILADYFLSRMKDPPDRLKVYELLMYHDVVEIEAGDSGSHPDAKVKAQKEVKAAETLKGILPIPLNQKFYDLFQEFEQAKTREARFAKAIDAFDALIHEIDYKKDWKGWTKEFLISKKAHYMEGFPELKQAFEEMVQFCEENEYFDQG